MIIQLLQTVFYFIVALAILIAVHEFGHFWVARLLGVKVLRFAIGFGKPIVHWKDKKETEYAICVFPLGGYVKMLDETEGPVPVELLPQAFNRKSVWARIAIVIAGPLFNILFAVFALWLMFIVGMESTAPIVGKVQAHSIAAEAQLKSMDEIVAVNNVPINSWRGLQLELVPLMGSDETVSMNVQNLKTGAHNYHVLNIKHWTLDPNRPDFLGSLGITPKFPDVPPVIAKIIPGHVAAKVGLQEGDKILSVNGEAINDWLDAVSIIHAKPQQDMEFVVERHHQRLVFRVTPESVEQDGHVVGFIGAQSETVAWPKEWTRIQQYSVIGAIIPAIQEVKSLTKTTFVLIGKFFTGSISLRNISGPIGIAQGAGQSAELGLAYYLSFLALVSISLGVLNILPIPMLDGGHLLYYVIEVILRRPVSEALRMAGMRLGIALLLALMILAVFNDVMRLVVL